MRPFALLILPLLSASIAPLSGPDRITAALVGRSVDYSYQWDGNFADHEVQSWTAEGLTKIANGSTFGADDISGRWRVENGRYCEIFGNQTEWTCLSVTLSDDGRTVRFREIRDEVSDYFVNLFEVDRTGAFLPQ
jgi:hypothetical protein